MIVELLFHFLPPRATHENNLIMKTAKTPGPSVKATQRIHLRERGYEIYFAIVNAQSRDTKRKRGKEETECETEKERGKKKEGNEMQMQMTNKKAERSNPPNQSLIIDHDVSSPEPHLATLLSAQYPLTISHEPVIPSRILSY